MNGYKVYCCRTTQRRSTRRLADLASGQCKLSRRGREFLLTGGRRGDVGDLGDRFAELAGCSADLYKVFDFWLLHSRGEVLICSLIEEARRLRIRQLIVSAHRLNFGSNIGALFN
jgi:hypothetical protein